MAVNWNMLMGYANPGENFANSFNQGMARRREQDRIDAYAGAAAGDPQAQQRLMRMDPERGMAMQRQQAEQAWKEAQRHQESIKLGAQIIRETNPQDQAGWEQTLQIAHSAGIDLTQVPRTFDPAYVTGMTKMADALAPERNEQTSMQRNYDFLSSKNPDLGQQYLRSQAEGPPQIITTADGRTLAVPRSGVAASSAPAGRATPQPGEVQDGYKFKGGNPADPASWEKVGGQPVAPAGAFPG
jgi:hypothetical protein